MSEITTLDPRTPFEQSWDLIRLDASIGIFEPVCEEIKSSLYDLIDQAGDNQQQVAFSLARGVILASTMLDGQRYRANPEMYEQRAESWMTQGECDSISLRKGWVVGCLARGLSLDAVDIASHDDAFTNYISLFNTARAKWVDNDYLKCLDFAQNLDRVMKRQGYDWNENRYLLDKSK